MKVRSYSKRSTHAELTGFFESLYPSTAQCPDRKKLEAHIRTKIARFKTFKEMQDEVIDHCSAMLNLPSEQTTQVLNQYMLDEATILSKGTSLYTFPDVMPTGPLRGTILRK